MIVLLKNNKAKQIRNQGLLRKNCVQWSKKRRNRLISSWSDKLIIIQAGKGSGALITAEYSRKYGRKVEMKAEI